MNKPTRLVLGGHLVFDTTEENRQVRYWARRFARNEKRRESEGERAKDAIRALATENWLPELRRCLAQLATRGPGQKVTRKAFFFLEQIELEIRLAELGDAVPDFDGGVDG